MTYEPARPRYTLPFAGKDYDLVGTLDLIEAVETAMKEGIIQVGARVIDMGVTDAARLVAAMLSACGYDTKARDVGAEIYAMGIGSDKFMSLKIHLFAFINIMLQPPELREETAEKMGEITGKLPQASPGDSTKSSA
jgi:hypothetical protein